MYLLTYIYAFFALFLIDAVLSADVERDRTNYSRGIVDTFGEDIVVQPNYYNYHVSIQHKPLLKPSYLHICSGAIIAPKWVLTIRECVQEWVDKVRNLRVLAGVLDLRCDNCDVQNIEVDDVIINLGQFHLGLLKMDKPYHYNIAVGPALISGQMNAKTGVVTGWGKIKRTQSKPENVLQKSVLDIIPIEDCTRTDINTAMVCTGAAKGDLAPCIGDIGSPLCENNENGQCILLGMSSMTFDDCKKANALPTFISIESELSFIREHVKGYYNNPEELKKDTIFSETSTKNSDCKKSNNFTRVVGGLEVVGNKYKYQASIQYTADRNIPYVHKCSGAVIDRIWILSAKHCAFNYCETFQGHFRAKVGIFNMNCYDCRAHNTVINDIRCDDDPSNDLALFRLSDRLEWTPAVNMIFFSNEEFGYPKGKAITTGWGSKTGLSVLLNQGSLNIIDSETCKSQNHSAHIICVGTPKDTAALCKGDEGAPLAQDNVLLGISTVVRKGCDKPGTPTVFTNPNYFYGFINKHVDWGK